MSACGAAAREAVDPVDILRHFVLAAPPGELKGVVKALRVVTGDDHLFFEVIPRLCMEHHMRHLTPFTMPAACAKRHESKVRFVEPNRPATVASGHVSFLAGRQNHLGTRIRCFAKMRRLHASNVAGDVEEYFRQQHFTSIPSSDRASQKSCQDTELDVCESGASGSRQPQTIQRQEEEPFDPFADIVPSGGFGKLEHVFFDMALQMYIEVDPVEQLCLRVIPFTSTVAPTMPEVLRVTEKQATGLHGGPLGHTRFLLQQEVARYVQACFGEAAAAAAETVAPQAERGAAGTREPSHPMGSARTLFGVPCTSTACAGSMVVLQPHSHDGGEDCQSLVIAAAAVRQFPRNMWCGRWKSIFVVECTTNPASEARVCVKGETQVYAHYYEEGNMHLEVVEELPPTPLPEWPVNIFAEGGGEMAGSTDTWGLCSAVMEVIQQHEQRIHDAVLKTARDSGDCALRALRRRLPITGQLFNFRRGQALPRPMFTRPGYDT
ncbi:F-actin capping protein [Trypanosoma conorhini]|uniref:F-actin capping protein n=1 Tax=Trypanosoma conorhini TaxID=83891 RepID=A0A422PRV9_9TRYP|nr:F-actin capping protein [Trypanosoma conorhini]RNF20495.1 F-actin capping protein [Trypanosoma conorhini]